MLSEHVFDKLRAIDCTLAEFDILLAEAEGIEEVDVAHLGMKELLLVLEWTVPLHVVVVVDSNQTRRAARHGVRTRCRPLDRRVP